MKATLEVIRASDVEIQSPEPLVGKDHIKLAAIIAILEPDWHPNYVHMVVLRYMVFNHVPLPDAVRAICALSTSPSYMAAEGLV